MVELPAPLRRTLPAEAQRHYRAAFRDAVAAGAPEEDARRAAQQAVEEAFRHVGDTWERREHRPTSGPPYGEEALAALLRRARFPSTTGQLLQQTGDPELEIAAGQPMRLSEVLGAVDGGYWPDARALLAAVHDAWPEVKKRWDATRARAGRNL